MEIVLGSGWPGILLHEAIGHGLEGDFNRKGSSAFSGRLGERVAAPGVTVTSAPHGACDSRCRTSSSRARSAMSPRRILYRYFVTQITWYL